jgi:hypothetical protein
MTCPDFVISSYGRRGIGVVQPQSGLDYPLVSPATEAQDDIRYLLADLYLEYDDPNEYANTPVTEHPLRIAYLYGLGCVDNVGQYPDFPTPAHAADIVIVDANNNVVFDTTDETTTFNSQPWGADYVIYEWRKEFAVCRLVAYSTWPRANDAENYDKYLKPVNALIDERAVYKMPKRVLSVRVKNGTTTSAAYTGKFSFINGYNVEIAAADPAVTDFRNETSVTFAAVAGTGKGRYTSCAEINTPKPITTINGVGANNVGDFLLASSDCLWARRPTTHTPINGGGVTVAPSTTAQQQIGADCVPCCQCEDYADTAKYMNDTSMRYRLIGARSENIRAYHENNVNRWNDQRACSLSQPLKLLFVPQRCPYIDVAVMLCNSCDTCTPASTLKLVIDLGGANLAMSLECGHSSFFATGSPITTPTLVPLIGELGYTIPFPQIRVGDSAYAQFRLKFTELDTAQTPPAIVRARGPYPIAGRLTATIDDTGKPLKINCSTADAELSAEAQTIQTLNCTDAGFTPVTC